MLNEFSFQLIALLLSKLIYHIIMFLCFNKLILQY